MIDSSSYNFFQNMIQLSIYSLALSLLLLYITTLPRKSIFFSALSFMVFFLLVNLVPIFKGNSLVEICRGAIGDVSISSGMFLLLICAKIFSVNHDKPNQILAWWEKIVLLILGLVLYLSTFGFISFDVYHFGYLSPNMLIFFSGATLISILLNRKLGYVWLAGIVGYYLNAQASNNLWDYMYDPLLWLIMVSDSLVKLASFINTRRFQQ